MLPDVLSADLTSLRDAQDRHSIVIELRILDSGEVTSHDIYAAWLQNHAKLAYHPTGAWMEGQGPMPPAIAAVPGMEAQLRLQLDTSVRLRNLRKKQGALAFSSIEALPVMQNGQVKDLAVTQHTVAADIIESFMVAANVAMARHLREKGALSLRRVVRTPKRWDGIQLIAAKFGVKLPDTPDPRALSDFLAQRQAADPAHFPDLSLSIVKLLGPGEYIVETPGAEHEGHFGLAVQDYTHSTAPNRRYADLVTQRLLKATCANVPGPYSETELSAIATHCTEREDAAKKVERLMRKVAAACLLNQHIGEVFDGVVTGASPKGTYVRLLKKPAEGRVIRGAPGLNVGDFVRVKLVSVNIAQGFIDFERQ
jgi:exoribonuclease-2